MFPRASGNYKSFNNGSQRVNLKEVVWITALRYILELYAFGCFLFRGMGLFIGVELVTDHTTKEPATEEAKRIVYK